MMDRSPPLRSSSAVPAALALAAVLAALLAVVPVAVSSEKLVLDEGTRVLLTRVRDYYGERAQVQGSGEIVERVAFERLRRLGLQPIQGEHAAQLNVQDDARRERVSYVVRPTIEDLRVSLGRDAQLTIAIEVLGPEVGEPLARCESEHEVDDDEIEAPESEAAESEAPESEAAEVVARRLVQPAVEACLDDLLEVRQGPPAGAAEGEPGAAPGETVGRNGPAGLGIEAPPAYRLAALDAAWLFAGAGRKGYPPAFWEGSASDLLRPMLERSDVRLCGGEDSASDAECPRALAVGIGILRQGLEPPPPASPVHVVALALDGATGEPLRAALAQAPRTLWMQADSNTLDAMLQRAAERALMDRIERFGPAPSQAVEVEALELPRWGDPEAAAGRLLWEEGAPSDAARVGVVVEEDGGVSGVEVLDAAGGDPTALAERARGWRFEPARRGGEPVPLYIEVSVAP